MSNETKITTYYAVINTILHPQWNYSLVLSLGVNSEPTWLMLNNSREPNLEYLNPNLYRTSLVSSNYEPLNLDQLKAITQSTFMDMTRLNDLIGREIDLDSLRYVKQETVIISETTTEYVG